MKIEINGLIMKQFLKSAFFTCLVTVVASAVLGSISLYKGMEVPCIFFYAVSFVFVIILPSCSKES
jgi:hypothetical protein